MTDTIEAVALWEAVREWQWPDGTTPREWFMQHVSAYTQAAIAAHTKALIEGAGELEAQLTGRAQFCEDRGEVKSPGLMREAAATIAALRAEIERLSAALHVIRRDVEVGIWCQSDIEWFVGEVLAGRQPDYLRALDAPVSGPLADSDGDGA